MSHEVSCYYISISFSLQYKYSISQYIRLLKTIQKPSSYRHEAIGVCTIANIFVHRNKTEALNLHS
jgi:hypothetical protein